MGKFSARSRERAGANAVKKFISCVRPTDQSNQTEFGKKFEAEL
jgi:hypothetical protein